MRKHFIFAIITMAFITLLLIGISSARLNDFYNYHTAIATESTTSAASEISRFIDEKKHLVKVFADDHIALISQLAENPDNEAIKNRLEQRIKTYFPDFFSFTISHSDGNPFMDDFDGFIGDLCILDLKNFAETNTQSPRIHPNSVAYHFDVLTKIEHQTEEIILFISFHADILGNILQSAQTNGHQLMLINPEASNLIEVTEKGARINTLRSDYRLDQAELDRILARSEINNTQWNTIDLYESMLFSSYRLKIIQNSALILLLFFLITLTMMTIIYRKEKSRIEAEKHKDEFLSVVSHELRTPITSIYGSLSLVANEVPGPLSPQSKELTKTALSNCERLNLLINDLLDLQKIEAGKMEFDLKPTLLDELITQCVSDNQGYAERSGVSFEIIHREPSLMVNIDSNRIAQIMANLLSNAAKYGAANDNIFISIIKINDYARVNVIDHGSGIPESFKNRIFHKFAQLEMSNTRNSQGTGLGLCIVKAIIEEHNGSIGFESKTGKGSTFYFDLPLYNKSH